MPPTLYHDLTIIGAGPTGLSAALNAASEGLSVAVCESAPELGGQAKYSSRIENYMGFPSGLTGPQLMSRAANQAKAFGAKFYAGERALELVTDGKYKTLELASGTRLISHALLVASGLEWRKLDVSGLNERLNAGVFYGAPMSIGENLRGSRVYIVGGANSAGQAALWASNFASYVGLVVRKSSLDAMSAYLVERISKRTNIECLFETEVAACEGEGALSQLRLVSGSSSRYVSASHLFVFIGAEPRTDFLKSFCNLDAKGFIETDSSYATSCSGTFAAGDVRLGSIKRVAAGVGEGASAVSAIHKYLGELK